MPINKVVYGAVTLIDITDSTVTSDKLVQGAAAYNKAGEKIEGSNPYELETTNTEVQTQTDLIEQIQDALKNKASGGGTTEIWTLTLEDGSEITKEVVIV